jgi:hypothetical protein
MALQRFRDLGEVPPPRSSGSPAQDLRAAFELVAFCHRLRPLRSHRGVQRRRWPEEEAAAELGPGPAAGSGPPDGRANDA